MSAHIIWDWNGTLLDDVRITLHATNKALDSIGLHQLSIKQYKNMYSVPVYDFYKKILGRIPSEHEWRTIGKTFNQHYRPNIRKASLSLGAKNLIQKHKSQSICSLMKHEQLKNMLDVFNLSEHICYIQGREIELSSEGKYHHLLAHIKIIKKQYKVDMGSIVVIGDASDDAEAALRLGLHTVLYSGGTHSHERLSRLKVPVKNSLIEAVECADNMVANTNKNPRSAFYV